MTVRIAADEDLLLIIVSGECSPKFVGNRHNRGERDGVYEIPELNAIAGLRMRNRVLLFCDDSGQFESGFPWGGEPVEYQGRVYDADDVAIVFGGE